MAGLGGVLNMTYSVYILESEKNGRYYVGCTQDLASRVGDHNLGFSSSTKKQKLYQTADCFTLHRGVAQPGSAHAWGACGRRFKSSRPDTYLPASPFNTYANA